MNIEKLIEILVNEKDLLDCRDCIDIFREGCNRKDEAVCLLESFVNILNCLKAKILESE